MAGDMARLWRQLVTTTLDIRKTYIAWGISTAHLPSQSLSFLVGDGMSHESGVETLTASTIDVKINTISWLFPGVFFLLNSNGSVQFELIQN